jgi:ACS family tartrate transporter-like MFS transporter
MVAATPSPAVVIIAFAVSIVAGIGAQATFWLIPSDRFTGHLAEVGIAAIGSIGMIGAFVAPYAFGVVRDYTGNYRIGLLMVASLFAASTVILGYSWRMDRAAAREKAGVREVAMS